MLELEPVPGGPRQVRIGSLVVGGARPAVIAGPCSVEPGFVEHAIAIAATGADALRAGVFKPRTRPDSFQGMGAEAITLLDQARAATGLPLVSEVLGPEDAELLAGHVDAFQVGARNMQNVRLLEALGEIGTPVVLKRGLAATIDEWVAASEYIRRRGNHDVVLCERGIRTFEPRTRNTLDLSAVLVARELSDLPVIVDPSHAAGRAALVPPLALAALAVGADGLLVEAHPSAAKAWSDGEQAVDLEAMAGIAAAAHRAGGDRAVGSVEEGRERIDAIDARIWSLLESRRRVSGRIQELRLGAGGVRVDPRREAVVVGRWAGALGGGGELLARTVLEICRPAPATRGNPE